MTDRFAKNMSTGDSTGITPDQLFGSPKLARAILLRAAKDGTPHGMERWCRVIGLSYEDYLQAVKYISGREGAQKKILMDRLRKSVGGSRY